MGSKLKRQAVAVATFESRYIMIYLVIIKCLYKSALLQVILLACVQSDMTFATACATAFLFAP